MSLNRTGRRRRLSVEISDPSSLRPIKSIDFEVSDPSSLPMPKRASFTCSKQEGRSNSSAHRSSSYDNSNHDCMGQQQQDVEDNMRMDAVREALDAPEDSHKGNSSIVIDFATDMQRLSDENDDGEDCISAHLDSNEFDEYSVEEEDIDVDEEDVCCKTDSTTKSIDDGST